MEYNAEHSENASETLDNTDKTINSISKALVDDLNIDGESDAEIIDEIIEDALHILRDGMPFDRSRATKNKSAEEIPKKNQDTEIKTLEATRHEAVQGTGTGVENPLVMVVDACLGDADDKQGQPFVGKSGQYLDKWLDSIGLSRHKNVYISNVLKWQAQDNRNPLPEEMQTCRAYLDAQIELLQPKFILALGEVVGNVLTNNYGMKINDMRSRVFECNDIPLYVTYHPSAVLANPDELRKSVWEDLQKLNVAIQDQLATQGSSATQDVKAPRVLSDALSSHDHQG